jgi:hypothetical protein
LFVGICEPSFRAWSAIRIFEFERDALVAYLKTGAVAAWTFRLLIRRLFQFVKT